jgi:hypothetical protein
MEVAFRTFGEKFSAAMIAKDYGSAHALLAPWLQRIVSPETLRGEIDQHAQDMCREWNMDVPVYPAACDLDGNAAIDVQGLREPDWDGADPNVPAEITDANYRYWMSLQFQPAEGEAEFDAFFDLWIALVEHDGALRVGYYKFSDPD